MRVLAISNQKGGCGKTTTSINLGASLAFLSKKVLLIDLDPQAHSTIGLGVKADQLKQSMYDVLTPQSGSKPTLQDITIHVEKNLWLAPSQIVLSAIEQQLAGTPKREEQLALCVATAKKNYDFVLIDCPPNLGILTFNALRAAGEVVITIEPSSFSVHGLGKINETIQVLRDQIQHHLIVHALLTMYDNRKRFIRDVVEEARHLYGSQVLRTVIRSNIRLREAAHAGRPITRFDRHSTGFHDYLSLASEIIERGLLQQKDDAASLKVAEETLNSLLAEKEGAVRLEEDEEAEEALLTGTGESEDFDESREEGIEFSKNRKQEISDRRDTRSASESAIEEISKEELAETVVEPGAEKSKEAFQSAEQPALETFQKGVSLEKEALSAPSQAEAGEGRSSGPLEVIEGIRKYPLKVSGGYLFICKSSKAKSVQIVGNFTSWVPVNMNSPGGQSGFWTRVFSLRPGDYKYKYIVDGEWVIDVNNERYERNPYGGVDSILEIS